MEPRKRLRVRRVERVRDNGKWEITVSQDGHDFEVELRPEDLTLLRVDYNTSRMR